MIRIKQNGETTLINPEMITYVSTYIDYRYDNEYRVTIKFVGDRDLVVSFSSEKDREQFLTQLQKG